MTSMDFAIALGRVAYLVLGIALFYLILLIIQKLSGGKIKADLFAAINCLLYLGIIGNLALAALAVDDFIFFNIINIIIFLIIIYFRKKSSGRLI